MMKWFDDADSLLSNSDGTVATALRTVADRYIGLNPVEPAVLRVFSANGFARTGDCRCDIDIAAKFPEMKDGQVSYAQASVRMREAGPVAFAVNCYGPVKIFVNGAVCFASNLDDEVFPDRRRDFEAEFLAGWNQIVLECTKTPTGCGAVFGSPHTKDPLHFLSPGKEREGMEGFIWSKPVNESHFPFDGLEWLPDTRWTAGDMAKGNLSRVFGSVPGKEAWAFFSLDVASARKAPVRITGTHAGTCDVFVDGEKVFSSDKTRGRIDLTLPLSFGRHKALVRSVCGSEPWGFTFDSCENASLSAPAQVRGLAGVWLYLGPFTAGSLASADAANGTNGANDSNGESVAGGTLPDRTDTVYGIKGEQTFWRADGPALKVKLYRESDLFGRWHYPLGVTLYGLYRTGVEIDDRHYIGYTAAHMRECLRVHRYSFWDRDAYGSPCVGYQLALMDSLDDCGSFGSAMLETARTESLPLAREIADYIADYIETKQSRLPDGTLYRASGIFAFMKDTIWCDDLYMSVPFLCRYALLTGDGKYLDDAAAQFLNYRKYCLMEDRKIMSHVYDLKHGRKTGVPWGRGNGWVIFSLTELLAVLPENHAARPALIAFFRELCEGYLALQGERGLWHQVLTDPESYEETSCTAMFVYAFARGAYHGWLGDAGPYAAAAAKGWNGIVGNSVDKKGNVYGVCRGSGYSYSASYYKNDLLPRLNDTHGIGIVLLAGVEMAHLQKYLEEKPE